MSVAFIVSNSGNISLNVNGKPYNVAPTFPTYKKVKTALKLGDAKKLEQILDVGKFLSLSSGGRVVVKDGVVYYNCEVLDNSLTKRLLALMREGFPFEPMARFIENLMKNPSKTAIEELYLFLEANDLPITEEGSFVAYRRVDKNYMSIHPNPDGTHNRNFIGDVVKMDRDECETNRELCNSKSLHFCSISYLPHYGSSSNGDKTMVVKIRPENVTSIPRDHSNAKGRCCEYEVIAEHFDGDYNDTISKSPLYTDDQKTATKTPPKRDKLGRFIKC